MGILTAISKAVGTLTSTGNPLNTHTVTIGGKVYTFQTTLTDSDGNVLIGADAEASKANLAAAIVLGPGSGTLYAASTTVHPEVTAVKATPTTLVATSKVAGTIGNFIDTTETSTVLSWGGTTLASGTGSVKTAIDEIQATHQINADVQQSLEQIEA